MNKETIEEAANKWIDSFYQKEKEYHKVGRNKCSPQFGFIAGAQWQKQQFITPTDEEVEQKAKEAAISGTPFSARIQGYTYMYQAGYKQALIDIQNQTK
jgi:hypothetical protein